MDLSIIEYDISTAAISQMEKDFLSLKIKGMDDKENYDLVHSARMQIKELRVKVQKREKWYKDQLNTKKKEVMIEAKKIYEQLEPIEGHLYREEKRIDDEKEAIRQEKIRKEEERVADINQAIEDINRLGTSLVGLKSDQLQTLLTEAQEITITLHEDETYMEFTPRAKSTQENVIQAIQTALEAQLKVEAEDREREAENERLEAIRKENEEKEQKLKEEAARQAEERRKVEQEKAQAKEQLRNARVTRLSAIGLELQGSVFCYEDLKYISETLFEMPAEEFESFISEVSSQIEDLKEQEAKEQADREARETEEKKQAEEEAKAKAEALKPDKERFLAWIETTFEVFVQGKGGTVPELPHFSNEDSEVIRADCLLSLESCLSDIRDRVEDL